MATDISTATTVHTEGTVATAASQVSKGDTVRIGRRDMLVTGTRALNRGDKWGRPLVSVSVRDAKGDLTLHYPTTSGISVVVA